MAKYKDFKPLSDWLTLEAGNNKIRIISEFEEFGRHYDEKTGKSTICIGKENCEFCKKGLKPTVQFLTRVIDRSNGEIKLFRYGYMIHKQLVEFAKSDQYGFEDIPSYDITIVKKGEKLATEYNVIPDRKDSPLTEVEQTQVASLKTTVKQVIEDMKAKVVSEPVEEKSSGTFEPVDEIEYPEPAEEISAF